MTRAEQDDRPMSVESAGVLREALLDAVQEYGAAVRRGTLTADDALQRVFALSRELRDRADHAERTEGEVAELQHRLSCLLCELTGNRMSKTNYDVRTMVQEVEAYFERTVDVEVAELRATVAKLTSNQQITGGER